MEGTAITRQSCPEQSTGGPVSSPNLYRSCSDHGLHDELLITYTSLLPSFRRFRRFRDRVLQDRRDKVDTRTRCALLLVGREPPSPRYDFAAPHIR